MIRTRQGPTDNDVNHPHRLSKDDGDGEDDSEDGGNSEGETAAKAATAAGARVRTTEEEARR